jgi:hypothetical protein
MVPWPSWLRRGANNAKISSSILLGTSLIRACGVVGSASALQAEGHRFDSGLVQYFFESCSTEHSSFFANNVPTTD